MKMAIDFTICLRMHLGMSGWLASAFVLKFQTNKLLFALNVEQLNARRSTREPKQLIQDSNNNDYLVNDQRLMTHFDYYIFDHR